MAHNRLPGVELFKAKSKDLLPFYQEVVRVLSMEEGCTVRPQTIYVVFSLNDEPVAAVYPRGDEGLEVALALSSEHRSTFAYDAAHLKWRKLPVAVTIHNKVTCKKALSLVREAARRVRDGEHDVNVDAETFGKHQRTPRKAR